MLLHIVKYHLHRRNSELVRTQKHERNIKLIDKLLRCLTSVILGIVNHEYCIFSPTYILTFQMFNYLNHEQPERIAIGLTQVNSVTNLSSAGQSAYKINPFKSYIVSDLISLIFLYPTSITMISELYDTFINIDDSNTRIKQLNVFRSSILSLKFSIEMIMYSLDRANNFICSIELFFHKLSKSRSANSQMTLLLK